jgi:hypothetical protein
VTIAELITRDGRRLQYGEDETVPALGELFAVDCWPVLEVGPGTRVYASHPRLGEPPDLALVVSVRRFRT